THLLQKLEGIGHYPTECCAPVSSVKRSSYADGLWARKHFDSLRAPRSKMCISKNRRFLKGGNGLLLKTRASFKMLSLQLRQRPNKAKRRRV
ncbi:MAG: hypothetical protein AAGE61_00680, partial [Pseudomonadota bacterium]